MTNHKKFLEAIHEKKLVKIQFNSYEKGIIQRICVPFDFGPWKKNISPNPNRYHLYDLDSLDGQHNLSLLPEKILSIECVGKKFNPAQYVTWRPPYKWFVPRNWGIYS
jgi:hypothetical protein